MRCLLVSYTDWSVNSTEHTVAFATGLAQLGCSVCVAINTGGAFNAGFAFFAAEPDGQLRPLGASEPLKPADVVHVWTPRAPIWRFLQQFRRLIGGALVLHFEDDETEVLRLFGAGSFPTERFSRAQLRARRLEDWTHPVLTNCLAQAVDGITILSPELAAHLPQDSAHLLITPPLPPTWWSPIPASAGLPDFNEEVSVIYAGGLHAAMADDFFELCRAIRLLRDRGRPVRLLRSGPEVPRELLETGASLAREFRDLGFLPLDSLRALLARATVLVQPGAPTKFNRGRLPAKIPPYLASGTPVVMPAIYAWLGVRNREHAAMFCRGNASDIADAIESVLSDRPSARAMAARAAAFARERFAPRRCCAPLLGFYESLPSRTRVSWSTMRHPRVELPLMFAGGTRATLRPPRTVEPITLLQTAIEEVRAPVQRTGPITVAQLFWPSRGGYREQFSSVCPLRAGRWVRLSFGPERLLAERAPRLDPGDRPGIVEITAIDYRSPGGDLLQRFRPPQVPPPVVIPYGTTIPLAPLRPNVWRWLSTGNDPQLLLPELGEEHQLRIECWIRWTALE